MEESQIRAVLGHLYWIRQQLDRFGMQPTQELTRGRMHNAAMITQNAAVALQWRYVYATYDSDRIADLAVRTRVGKRIDKFIKGVRDIVAAVDANAEHLDCASVLTRLLALIDDVIDHVVPCFPWRLEIQKMPQLLDRLDPVELLSEHVRQRASLINSNPSGAAALEEVSESSNAGLRNTLAISLSQDVRLAIEGLSPETQQAIEETTRVFLMHHATEAISGANAEGQNRWRNLLKSLVTVAAKPIPPAAG